MDDTSAGGAPHGSRLQHTVSGAHLHICKDTCTFRTLASVLFSLGCVAHIDGAVRQDRYRRVSDYVRPHPFEPNRAKVWAPPTESPPAWPYQERVRGGRSPSPQKTRTEASPFALADHGRPVTSNQIYGARVEPSPHDAARGDAKEARGSIDQHKTAFFGPMNWRTDAGSKLTGDPKVYHHVGGN